MGDLLAESARFDLAGELCVIDIDTDRIAAERLRNQTFTDAAEAAGRPEDSYRRIIFEHAYAGGDIGLVRPVARFPFVPHRRRTARRRLLRGVQHPGRRADAPHPGDRGPKAW